jgi:ubiquinone/menaquinone biosynthesis C-methylase UbiE
MLKIEIGGGCIPKAGYINLDYMKHPAVHHSLDFNKDKLPFEDSTVDEIYSNHCLEHLNPGYGGFIHCIEEMWRVSKPDAKWFIRVPYFNSHHTVANPFHVNNIFNEYTFHYFSDEHKGQPHSSTFVRKGSCMEYHLRATLKVDAIVYEYFDNYKYLENYPEDQQLIYRHERMNVVNNIAYHIRAEKPDFWEKERQRNSYAPS